MKTFIRRSIKAIFALFVLAIIGIFILWIWFWAKPVGVKNYINKVTFSLLLDQPELLTSLGMIDNTPLDFHSGKLGDYTKQGDKKSLAKLKKARQGLDKYGPDKLKDQDLLSWQITAWFFDDLIRQSEFEYSGYPITQLDGVTVNLPQFLTDSHVIKNKKSVRRYISRLNEFERVLKESKDRVEDYRDHGVVAPDFIIEGALKSMRSFIKGGVDANPLVTTMPEKLDKIKSLSAEEKAALMDDIKKAVSEKIIPGYQDMIALHEQLASQTNHDAGIWRIPNGDKIYQNALRSNTTLNISADEIHAIGISEVKRIASEMDAILRSQGYENGSVAERIKILMQDPNYQFEESDKGRAEMRAYLQELNKKLLAKAGDYFITLPKQELVIKRVPKYSQDGAPGGYYQPPALDGSLPGRFYINQKSVSDNPKWTLPTLMFHEGAPGHHFQISRAQMIKGVPMIRKLGPFTAYSEGWALYAEKLAAEDMGMYENDPLGNLGRLQAEMFRAVRLVVDTGMHAKHWSREQAIKYMMENTGMTEAEVTREIERYVVWPAQATAYKTGQLAILRMRARAEKALGDKFDLRAFNEILLQDGAMPLDILDRVVDEWIVEQKKK